MTVPGPRSGHRDDDHADRTAPADGGSDLPRTGEPEVDRALESLQTIGSAPLEDHHELLSRVHEDLHRALNPQQGPA